MRDFARHRGPECSTRPTRPVDQGGEFRPGDLCLDGSQSHHRPESAIGSGHDSLATDHLGESKDSLADDLGVLDEIRRRIETTRDDQLVARKREVAPEPPFVGVSRVRALETQAGGSRREDDLGDLLEGDVMVVWPFVVAPANVHAHAVGGDPSDRCVQHFDVHARHVLEFLEVEPRVLRMPRHGEVGAIDLEHEARSDDRLVFAGERGAKRFEVVAVRWIVVVQEEGRDDTRRGRRDENVRCTMGLRCTGERVEIALDQVEAFPLDRLRAGRDAQIPRRHVGRSPWPNSESPPSRVAWDSVCGGSPRIPRDDRSGR